MRVLITGGAGFVGRHMASHAAASGAHVVTLARAESGPEGVDEHLSADLTDPAAAESAVRLARPDRVVHLAASASVAESWRRPRETIENNVAGTLNLLEAVRAAAPAARVLVAGSGEEYGTVDPALMPVAEATAMRPQTPYAVSKASAGLLAGFYSDAHGLDVIRTRAFNHAGPGQDVSYVVSSFARQIAQAEAAGRDAAVIATGDLSPRRDFTDVRDVVRAYWLALESAPAGAYNVASGSPVAIAHILDLLAAGTAVRVDQRTDASMLRENEVMEICGSHEKLTEATGWRPEIPLERTLADTLDWWRAEVGR